MGLKWDLQVDCLSSSSFEKLYPPCLPPGLPQNQAFQLSVQLCVQLMALIVKYTFKHCSFSMYFMQFFPPPQNEYLSS